MPENKAKIRGQKSLKESKQEIATEAAPMPKAKPRTENPKPKSITRVGPEDECSDEDAFGQEMKNADARPEGGDVSE